GKGAAGSASQFQVAIGVLVVSMRFETRPLCSWPNIFAELLRVILAMERHSTRQVAGCRAYFPAGVGRFVDLCSFAYFENCARLKVMARFIFSAA
ncbi:unnamed protein product, partial [Amoebophrya sp. A120]